MVRYFGKLRTGEKFCYVRSIYKKKVLKVGKNSLQMYCFFFEFMCYWRCCVVLYFRCFGDLSLGFVVGEQQRIIFEEKFFLVNVFCIGGDVIYIWLNVVLIN